MFYMFYCEGKLKEDFYKKARENSFLEKNSRIRMDRFEEGAYFGSLTHNPKEINDKIVKESNKIFDKIYLKFRVSPFEKGFYVGSVELDRDFEDICSDNILNIENDRKAKRDIASFPNHFKQINEKKYYDLDSIENEMWDYALSNLDYDEQEYMKDMFENFKKRRINNGRR